jgi:putative FmdB family regulatory protein
MPIYAYRCDACGHTKDALQKMSDAPLVDCPECGKPALKKQVTAAGFQLKGSGWYVTDFREGSKTKPAEGASAAAPAPSTAADSSKAVAPSTASAPAPAAAAPAPALAPAPAAKP